MIARIRSLITRHPVAAFLTLAYLGTVAVTAPTALTRSGLLPFGTAPFNLLGNIFGSAVPALIVVTAVGGWPGVRELARRILRWRVGLRWYAFAILSVPVAAWLAAVALVGPAPLAAMREMWPRLVTEVLPYLLFLVAFSNLWEEVGWTGFLFDRWQDRYSPLKASLLVWVPWALFHIPFFYQDTGSIAGALELAGLLALPQLCSRFVAAWLYNNTHRSVFMVGVFHSAFNATTGPFSRTFLRAPIEDQFLALNGVVILAGLVILLVTRGRLSYRAEASWSRGQPGASPP